VCTSTTAPPLAVREVSFLVAALFAKIKVVLCCRSRSRDVLIAKQRRRTAPMGKPYMNNEEERPRRAIISAAVIT
jgi:hypothetical protein